ncbi:MAG: VIT1/CCC1 transporter family protein [Oligoflexia bacterium]|nr:VIT1/CCC1 transporter family protein [Oligoflexia bacterium]
MARPVSHHHVESHFESPQVVRDLVLGVSDGLTVPFALAAGLFGAQVGTSVIVTAGLAESAAGSIAMGLGGYLAARGELEHYRRERAREFREIKEIPHVEEGEIYEVFEAYGLEQKDVKSVVDALVKHPEAWVDFMMRFELGLEKPDDRRAIKGAVTIGAAYIIGGIIPLSPYIAFNDLTQALQWSIILTGLALIIFGYIKGKYLSGEPKRSALQTLLVGGAAAAVAFFVARLIGGS